MGCDYPLTAYRSQEFSPATGKYGLTFNPLRALNSQVSFRVPCGQCTGCRLERSRQWAARCLHEASLHMDNCFVTLTYADPHLPIDGSIHKRHFQLFIKRLRKHLHPTRIRFFGCGEYGDTTARPHYHLLIFGWRPADLLRYDTNDQGQPLYLSKTLQRVWLDWGRVTIGDLTHQSAGYVARYNLKKIGGPRAAEHYTRVHPIHGFYCRVQPEFLLMSRKPGLGQGWFDKYGVETFVHDSIIIDGREAQPPRYYYKQLSEEDKRRISRKRAIASKETLRPRTYNAEMAHSQTRDAKISKLRRKL